MKKMSKLLSILLITTLMGACTPKGNDSKPAGTTGTTTATSTDTSSPSSGGTGLKDGKFVAEAQGHNAPLTLEVTIADKQITAIDITDHKETEEISDPALDRIPKGIIEAQSLAVDTVSGATYTSNAILTAVENALIEAGGDIAAFKENKGEEKEGTAVSYEADVIVVGAGIAGVSAALEATNQGAKVILLEKMASIGGSTIRSGGKIQAAGTSIQKAAGIEDTPEQFVDYLMEVGENQVDRSFIELIANNSADNVEWLISNGVELSDEIELVHSSITPARGHFPVNGSGSGIVLPLYEKLKEKNVQVLLETPALSLISEEGRVIGVKATNLAKDDITITAKAVILATGGFSRNPEYIAEYYPSSGNFTSNAGDGNTGDGITMGLSVDADLVMPDGGINLALNPYTYYGYGEEAKGLFVTPEGERFMDESVFHFKRTRIMMDEGIDNCWYIFDESVFNDRVAKSLEEKMTVEAGSIEELAEKMSADPTKLKATIEKYNELAKKGEDTDFNKSKDFMEPIESGKYYAAHFVMSNSGTHGGLKIDIDSHVINKSGDIIPGLYAAGEVASGQILHKEYPGSGTALIAFLTFGRQAGAAAANEK